ncbi:MAG TPA: hypothetical protein VN228_02320 [Pyrinomonadaceae bacterium]|nr:hypothetical protein [Pyrinomonadaceae bacterium]
MSTERNLYGPDSPGVTPNDSEDVVGAGDLFIRDLPSTGTAAPALGAQPSAGNDDADEEDGMVTTMMLGEEGDRGGEEKKEKKEKGDEGRVTTMALGEEGDRGGVTS